MTVSKESAFSPTLALSLPPKHTIHNHCRLSQYYSYYLTNRHGSAAQRSSLDKSRPKPSPMTGHWDRTSTTTTAGIGRPCKLIIRIIYNTMRGNNRGRKHHNISGGEFVQNKAIPSRNQSSGICSRTEAALISPVKSVMLSQLEWPK